MHIGYVRVSTEEQNPARQQALLRELGVDEIFLDKASGKNTDRPELKRMLAYVRKGDTVIVESISRFARNTRDLLELIEQLTAKEVEFVSKKEAIDTTTPTGKFMLTVFAAVAELERDYILQRQREGIALAETLEDAQLVEMYAAYLVRKRATTEPMPRMLRWALNNRLFSQKAVVDNAP